MTRELTKTQAEFMAALNELDKGDHWLCFVNAGHSIEDAKTLWEAGLIEATMQMGMPTAQLRRAEEPPDARPDDGDG